MNSIEKILNAFEENNIDYVHWKSNTEIEEALSGEDDLDLLVNLEQKKTIYELFKNHNFIRGYSIQDSWQKEVFHYFGLDLANKKLIHIHIHFLIELEYEYDKYINLPIVKNYIEQQQKYKYINIPTYENEYILLIIRLILQNDTTSFILKSPKTLLNVYMNQKNGVIKGNTLKKYYDLKNLIDRNKLDIALALTFPFIEKSLFYKCENIVKKNNSLKYYFQYSKKLKKVFKSYQYHSNRKSFFLSFYRLNKTRIFKYLNRQEKLKKLPEHGGKVFAFIGGDGAGKSTNIEKLQNILNKHFYVKTIHIGRPKLHIIGNLLLVISKISKLLGLKDLRQALIYLAIAYGRKKEFQEALKIKSNGGIVILDRIPLDGVTSMDSPRIHTLADGKFKLFSKIEKSMHKMIQDVDRLIVLKLNPQLALKRRPEDDPDELLIRSGQIWNKDFTNIKDSYVINTENSFDFVEKEILNIIWRSMNEI